MCSARRSDGVLDNDDAHPFGQQPVRAPPCRSPADPQQPPGVQDEGHPSPRGSRPRQSQVTCRISPGQDERDALEESDDSSPSTFSMNLSWTSTRTRTQSSHSTGRPMVIDPPRSRLRRARVGSWGGVANLDDVGQLPAWPRHCGEQPLRVRMLGVVEHAVGQSPLDHLAPAQHDHLLGHLAYHRQLGFGLLDFVGRWHIGSDPLLKQEQAVDDRFGSRWATRHVNVDRDDLVDALKHCVIREHAARTGACPHRHHPLGLKHLVVDLPDRRSQLVGCTPDTITRSACRGDARNTSDPNRPMS